MTRRTSITAYHANQDVIKGIKRNVYNLLYEFGPLTANQIILKYNELHPRGEKASPDTGSITTRLSELRRDGGVYEVSEDYPCPINGNKKILWDVTDGIIVKYKKPRRIKCKHCRGKGFIEDLQSEFIL